MEKLLFEKDCINKPLIETDEQTPVTNYLPTTTEKGDIIHCLNCGETILQPSGLNHCSYCETDNYEIMMENTDSKEANENGYIICNI